MPGHDVLVVGASAGGVEALSALVGGLPADLPASLFVVLHVPAHGTSMLPNILDRRGSLPASHPEDGEPIRQGRIYVAPPDRHLLIERDRIRLVAGPKENGHRPAVDPVFRTAARTYGRRVVGVVLSGNLDDGTAGLLAIKQQGGIAVVQDPDESLFSGMPRSALENVDVDYRLPLAGIAPLLVRLAHQPVVEEAPIAVAEEVAVESDIAEFDLATLQGVRQIGTPSGFTCPECHGALWEVHDGDLTRFRCRVGHAFSADSLLFEQSEALEAALWAALRALEESAALAQCLARRAADLNHRQTASRFTERARERDRQAELIRRALLMATNQPDLAAPPGGPAQEAGA